MLYVHSSQEPLLLSHSAFTFGGALLSECVLSEGVSSEAVYFHGGGVLS